MLTTGREQLEEREARLATGIGMTLEEQRSSRQLSHERPKIGILASEVRDASAMATIVAIAEAGGSPLLLPTYPIIAGLDLFDLVTDEQAFRFIFDTIWPVIRDLDGLVLIGNGDLDSRFYRKIPHPKSPPSDPWCDLWEWLATLLCWVTYKTTFGVGRGAQLMNVALAGGLFQDRGDLRSLLRGTPPLLVHQRGKPGSNNSTEHPLFIVRESWLAQAVRERGSHASLRYTLDSVVSMHHTFIGIQRLGFSEGMGNLAEELIVAGYAPDGVIEAVASRDPRRIYVAVQFHPEHSRTLSWSSGIFNYVIGGCLRDAVVPRSLFESYREDIFMWLWLRARTLHGLQNTETGELAPESELSVEQERSTDALPRTAQATTHV